MNKQVYRILIIDDSAKDRAAFRHHLNKNADFQFTFLEEELGEAGVKTCLAENPDCVLLDFDLPDTNGLEIVKRLNPDPLSPAFAIILLTGSGNEKLAVKILKNGAQDYLVKDKITPQEIQTSVLNAIEIVKLRGERKQAAEVLRLSEERLKLGADVAGLVIAEIDYLADTVFLPQNAARLFGVANEEITVPRSLFHETFHPDDRAEVMYKIQESLNPDGSGWFASEYRVVHKNGEIRWLSVRKQNFFERLSDSSRPVRGILAAQDITERKKSEEQLRLYEKVILNARDAVLITEAEPIDLPGPRILYVNPAFTVMTGYTPEDVTGQTPRLLQGAKSDRRQLDKIRRALQKWEPVKVGLTNYRKDGTEFDVEFDIVPVADETGWFTHWVSIQRDVTERKLNDEKLRHSEERLNLAMKGAQIGTFDWNIKTGEIQWSSEIEELVAMSASDFNNSFERFMSIVHPQDRELIERRIADALQNGEYECEFRMLKGDGTIRWVIAKGSVFYDDEGQPARLLGVDIDITKRKLAEEALLASQRFTESIVETAPSVIYTFDLKTKNTTYLTKQAAKALGYTFEEFKTAAPNFLTSYMHPEDAGPAAEHFEKIGEVENGDVFELEYRMHHKSGDWHWFRSRDMVFKRDENGRAKEILGVAHDITERKQAEENLRRNHETLYNLVHNAPFGVYVVDADFLLTHLSAGSRNVFGNVDPLIGRDFAEVIRIIWSEPFASEVIEIFRHTLSTGEPYRAENTTEQRGDIEDTESYDWKIERITLPDGRFGVVCYFYDLTERKQFEEKLRESEERMRLILSAANIGIWTYDLVSQHIYWSPEHYEIFRTDEFDGTAEGFLKFVHPDDLAGVWSDFTNSIENGVPYQPEFRIVCPNEETRWVGNYGHVEYDADGKPMRFLGTVFDITERKRRELNLAFVADVQKDFGRLSTAEEIMSVFGARINKHLNLNHCLFVEINEPTNEAVIMYDSRTADAPDLAGSYRITDFHTESELQRLVIGKIVSIDDVADGERSAEAARQFSALGIGSLATSPYVSDGRWKFALSVQHSQPHQWRSDECELLNELTARTYLRLERARTEKALRQSEERFRSLFDSIDEGFCIIEVMFDDEEKPLDYRFAEINPAFARLTGLADAVGKTARELVPGLEDFWLETYGQVALTGQSVRFESQSGPMQRWFDIYASRVGDATSRRVAIVFSNITERKTAEQVLRETAEFNRTVLESSQDCVKLLDTEGRLEYMNVNGQCLLEITDFEPFKKQFWWNLWTDGQDEVRGSVEKALRGETVRFQGFAPTAKGTEKWWDVMVSPVRGASGEIVRLLSVSRDISEAKRYEFEREEMLQREKVLRSEAEAANVAKDEFLAMLSHELRTPLNAMYGWAQILEASNYDRELTKQALDIISRNVRLQNKLIEDLLDVSRIISGKMKLESDNLSLVATVRASFDAARPAAEKQSVKLDSSLDPQADEMFGDKNRLQQVVGNLLTNAIKFTPENGTVRLTLERVDDTAKISLKDSGIGIAPELLPHIFDRFKQADASSKRKYGGLGLGLTIVKHLVELHGGTIEAYSDGEGTGATFTVEIPLAPQAVSIPEPKPAKITQGSHAPNAKPLAGKRILVVDDDLDALDLICFVLEHKGANVSCVSSADEAWRELSSNHFDLLISDLGMAGMDGYDLIRKVRESEIENAKTIPAIALTGYVSTSDRERVLEAGFQTHLPKPLDIINLSTVAQNLMKK